MHLDTARWLEFCSLRCRLFFKDIFFTLDLTWSRWRWICRRRWWRGTWRAWLGFWIISHWCWWWWPIWWWWRWCDLHFHFRWPLWVWPLFFSHQCHWRPCRNFWTNNSCIKIKGGKLFCLSLIVMTTILPLHPLDKFRDGLQLEPPLCTQSR